MPVPTGWAANENVRPGKLAEVWMGHRHERTLEYKRRLSGIHLLTPEFTTNKIQRPFSCMTHCVLLFSVYYVGVFLPILA